MAGLAKTASRSEFPPLSGFANSVNTNRRGLKTRVDRLFGASELGETGRLPQPGSLGHCKDYLSTLRLVDGALMVVASGGLVQDAIKIYGLCREIETLFGCLKGRGFKPEETRVGRLSSHQKAPGVASGCLLLGP
ncbi:hypothetical protein [Methyloglobulus sp.]|uniref:hypothetical protein n=1 Tax=Methyloglobulus sp. TaxID=2518622 RepID=UPI00398A3F28